MTRHAYFAVPLLAVALFVVACKKEVPVLPLAAAPRATSFAATSGAPAAGGAVMKMQAASATDRRIAYTQSFALELPGDAVQAAVDKAAELCLAAGCTVQHTRVDRLPDGSVQGSLSARIAPEKYQQFASSVTGPPVRVISRAESADDQTVAVLDIERRLAAQIALRDRLTQLLGQANGSVGDLVAIEKQLAEVQGEIESQTAQRDFLHTITDTVRVEISYNGLIQQAGPFDLSPVRAAIDDFVRTMVASAGDVITSVAAAVPWAPLVLVGLWLLRLVIRRR
jgi:Domain of unknown function (DUF4349)